MSLRPFGDLSGFVEGLASAFLEQTNGGDSGEKEQTGSAVETR
ncbi:MAG: hypothetical protein VBE63_18540 [Lamprobacter sp.]|nr:hypothetical protein [Lamprobacter sp.]MEA3641915.1 hypothetical protein [Lamprobacter sp.]